MTRGDAVAEVVYLACGYEFVSGHSKGRLPTLSRIAGRHLPFAILIVVWLIVHLYPRKEHRCLL